MAFPIKTHTDANIVAAELERVLPNVPTLFEREDTFYSTIQKRDVERIGTRDMRVPLELRTGGSFGHFDPDGGDLGLGSAPYYDKATVNTVHLKHAVQWTKKMEWATDDSRKAVINHLRQLLAKGMAEFRRNVDSLCMTTGDGILAKVSAVSNDATNDTLTLAATSGSGSGFGARLLRYQMPVAVVSSDKNTNRTAGTDKVINFLDLANKQVKYAAGSQLAQTNDFLVVGGLGNVTGSNLISINGVQYHHNTSVSSGTWQGMDKATVPEIRPNKVTVSGALSIPNVRLAINKVGDRLGSDAVPKMVAWMHPAQKQAYEEMAILMSQIQRGPSGSPGFDPAFGDNMQIAGIPIKTHFSWDRTRIDFIANEIWGRAEFHPAGFYEVDGRRIFEIRGSSGGVATSQIFYITASFNLFVKNPAQIVFLESLTVPSGY
jgi:hypothetical protein